MAAGRYYFDPYLIAAFCKVESDYNTWAVRYEPEYRWLYGDVRAMSPTERKSQMMSYGLMQIMGAVARERGFKERYLTQLCTPSIGITFGVKHLAWLRDSKGYSGDDLVSAYNQGSPRRLKIKESSVGVSPDAKYAEYKNQHYVDKINSVYQGLVEKRVFSPNSSPISVA